MSNSGTSTGAQRVFSTLPHTECNKQYRSHDNELIDGHNSEREYA